MRSRRAQACASRARGSPSCCGKRGLSLAATPPHAERSPGRGRRGPGGPAPKAAQGPGRGGRHRASVRRRVRSAHPSLSGARLGQERGRPAHSSAGPKRQSGDARRARLGASRAHCSDQPNQTKLRLHRSPGGDRPPLRSEEHTSELQSHSDLVCRLLLEKKKRNNILSFFFTKKKKKTNK